MQVKKRMKMLHKKKKLLQQTLSLYTKLVSPPNAIFHNSVISRIVSTNVVGGLPELQEINKHRWFFFF